MYLLDTNTCIFLINRKPAPVMDRLRRALNETISVSVITAAELQFGVYNSRCVEKNRIALTEFLSPFRILDFNDRDAEWYGKIRSWLKKEGNIIGPYDMLIAAQALSRDLILVTNNTDEFGRVKDLRIEDWSK
jgi:tRNA(fMet)-specific endonuclease VapC